MSCEFTCSRISGKPLRLGFQNLLAPQGANLPGIDKQKYSRSPAPAVLGYALSRTILTRLVLEKCIETPRHHHIQIKIQNLTIKIPELFSEQTHLPPTPGLHDDR